MPQTNLRTYRLLRPDGVIRESALPGTLGGNCRLKIYGRLNCFSAIRALGRGYGRHRVFFRDEAAAISAGYRPCAKCLPERYHSWNAARSDQG